MRCDELAAQLTDLMEGTLPADVEGAALEHLASCEACVAVLAETEAAVALVGEHGRVAPDEQARARMLAAIVADLRSGSAS